MYNKARLNPDRSRRGAKSLARENEHATRTISIVMVITLIGKILGLYRDHLMAVHYGTAGMEAKAFYVASRIPRVFFDVVFASAIAACFIPVFSEYLTKKGKQEAFRFGGNFLSVMTLLTALLTGLGILFAEPLVTLFADGYDAQTAALAASLTRVMFPTVLFTGVAFSFVGILQAVGDSRHPLYYLIVSSVVNLVLDIVFIGFVKTGVGGAALATVISQMVSAFLCLLQMVRSKEIYRLELKRIAFDGKMLKEIIRIGLPSGVQNSIIAFANVVVQSNINAFGEMAMAGYGAYTKVEGFGFLPITSFTMALTTFVGQNLGAKQYDRTRKGAKFGILVTVVLAELIGIVVFIFAPQMIAAFDATPEVIAFGIDKSRTAALFYCLLAYSHAIAAVMRGAGKAMMPMVVMMAFWCVVRVTFLSITVPLTHSIQMVYWVYPLTWALSSLTFFYYYKKANWMSRI